MPSFTYCPVCATPLADRLVTGRSRRACPACSFVEFLNPKVVVTVVVEHAGRVLLGRRNIDPGRGEWSFPGGYVDRGEPVEAAARREVKEETNLDVVLDGLLGVYSAAGQPVVLIAYRAHVGDSTLAAMIPQPEEVSELRFFPLDALPPLAFPHDPQILRDWRAGR